jgi:hypothetical protein
MVNLAASVFSLFDAIWFTSLSLCTIGGICALILIGIIVLYNLELTALDTRILVWMIVAFCVSAVVLASALYLTCCTLKYSKLILAILYTIFDLFVLLVAIAVLALRPTILEAIGSIWSDESQSAIVQYFEEKLNCCGFNQKPSHDCKGRTESCSAAIDSQIAKYSGVIGGISIALFIVLLAGVVVSFVRALKAPAVVADESKTQEITQLNEKLTADSQFWF